MPQADSAITTALPESRVVSIAKYRKRYVPAEAPKRSPEMLLCIAILESIRPKQRKRAKAFLDKWNIAEATTAKVYEFPRGER